MAATGCVRCLGALLLAVSLFVSASLARGEGALTVFAAASMADAMKEIADGFEAATGRDVAVSVAGSSLQARQIARGAPADVFVSANPGWMDWLAEKGALIAGTRGEVARNRLVLIAHGRDAPVRGIGADLDLRAMLGDGRLALALVEAVPAGIYAKAALSHLRLWESVAGRVVETGDVRAALDLVAMGAAPLGIVYATDAMAEADVTVVGTFPATSHPPIRYPGAAIEGGDGGGARAFLTHLREPSGRAVLARHGFRPPDE